MAATYDVGVGGTTEGGTPYGLARLQVLSFFVDLNQLATDQKSGTAFVANDVLQCIDIPANTHVLAVGLNIYTAEGSTMTLDIGDGTTTDGYIDGIDATATTNSAATGVAESYGADNLTGKTYTSADTIDIKVATIGAQTTHTLKACLWAIVVMCGGGEDL